MRLENISFSYNGSEKIFDNVNFTLEYGDFVLLSGVSGEGKSTLLSIINGMIPFITLGSEMCIRDRSMISSATK